MVDSQSSIGSYVQAIKDSGLSIYDAIPVGDDQLWMPSSELERALDSALNGISLAELPLRTRSRVVKEHVCRALGYPVPKTFTRTQPRFPGQHFDVYVQKSTNLQIWNEELEATRRYVIVRVGQDDAIKQVKVVTGEDLARLDATGTLTQKYQARLIPNNAKTEIVADDTDQLSPLVTTDVALSTTTPTAPPQVGQLLPIRGLFECLRQLIGERFLDPGPSQDRNRGAMLHRLICERLGYATYADDGRFPDIRHQLLEVKLQTSPTIDLGLIDPHSNETLDVPRLAGIQPRHCDVRYAIFFGVTDRKEITLSRLFVTTGEMFFVRFAQFQGKVLNSKIQIPLPSTFFDDRRL